MVSMVSGACMGFLFSTDCVFLCLVSLSYPVMEADIIKISKVEKFPEGATLVIAD